MRAAKIGRGMADFIAQALFPLRNQRGDKLMISSVDF